MRHGVASPFATKGSVTGPLSQRMLIPFWQSNAALAECCGVRRGHSIPRDRLGRVRVRLPSSSHCVLPTPQIPCRPASSSSSCTSLYYRRARCRKRGAGLVRTTARRPHRGTTRGALRGRPPGRPAPHVPVAPVHRPLGMGKWAAENGRDEACCLGGKVFSRSDALRMCSGCTSIQRLLAPDSHRPRS